MEKIMGIVRTGVAAVAGFVVALGWINSADMADFVTNIETIIGSALGIAAAVASVLAKIKAMKAAKNTAVASAATGVPVIKNAADEVKAFVE